MKIYENLALGLTKEVTLAVLLASLSLRSLATPLYMLSEKIEILLGEMYECTELMSLDFVDNS